MPSRIREGCAAELEDSAHCSSGGDVSSTHRASGAGASGKLRPEAEAGAAPVARWDLPTRNSVKYSLWPAGAWPCGLRDLDLLDESERHLQNSACWVRAT